MKNATALVLKASILIGLASVLASGVSTASNHGDGTCYSPAPTQADIDRR